MAIKIVLISDDKDFFEYIRAKLELRKSDELYMFSFDDIPERIHLLKQSVLIVNSEASKEKTLDLLSLLNGTPVIVTAFNEDNLFKRKCYRAGMFDYITLLVSDSEFRARMIPALGVASILEKTEKYRDLLVRNKIISNNNEVFLDYSFILDKELENIKTGLKKAVFMAISPDDRVKFLLQPVMIETAILNNIRKNDILINYAPNKYFLLLFDIELKSAQKLWEKIVEQIPQKIYAGFAVVLSQKREQLINEALNKLHEAINLNKDYVSKSNPISNLAVVNSDVSVYSNFKLYRQEFVKKMEQIITPVFYQVNQKYAGKLAGIALEQGFGDGYGTFYIKGKTFTSCFRITSPGFSKINIDITYQKGVANINAKRITLEPEELEAGLLEDLLEQFILENRMEQDYDNS